MRIFFKNSVKIEKILRFYPKIFVQTLILRISIDSNFSILDGLQKIVWVTNWILSFRQ